MSAVQVLREKSIGETREIHLLENAPVEIRVRRWSEAKTKALWGQVYCARVGAVDRVRRGAFLKLGPGREEAFLPLNANGLAGSAKLAEGMLIEAQIAREAVRGKNATAAWVGPATDGALPGLLRDATEHALPGAVEADREYLTQIDGWIEGALARVVPIPGGGALSIEPTQALVAIDVDSRARVGGHDGETFALALNLDAAREIMRQVRLRALGGLIAIDFVSMRQHQSRARLQEAMRAHAKADPLRVQMENLSRFATMMLSREQRYSPLHETLSDADGAPSAETIALNALRAVEREARQPGGRFVKAHVHEDVLAWLESEQIAWRDALQARIGARWTIVAGPHKDRSRIVMETT